MEIYELSKPELGVHSKGKGDRCREENNRDDVTFQAETWQSTKVKRGK